MPALGWSNSAFVGVWRSVVVRGKAFDITLTAGKLRKVDVWGVPFMEQNKAKVIEELKNKPRIKLDFL